MVWDPAVDVVGECDFVVISATDIESTTECERFLALKTHKRVKRVDGWERLWPPLQAPQTFALQPIRDIVRSLGSPVTLTTDEIRTRITIGLDSRKMIRQLRPFVEHAIWNILDAYDRLEVDAGALHFVAANPEIGARGRLLSVWADCYDTDRGIRQVHRLRYGGAQDQPASELWAVTAARIAADLPGLPTPKRIQVIEIGCEDGSTTLVFDGDAASARSAFTASAQPRATALSEADHVQPCMSCGECKAAGSCHALMPLDGFLGQSSRGLSSRSVSATDLSIYKSCPARWLMRDSKLPKDHSGSPAADRGRAVHAWLKSAHLRGIACTERDLPHDGAAATMGETTLDADQYAAALPFLRQHVGVCALATPGTQARAVDTTLRGYDHTAEVVVAMAPDLVYDDGSTLVVREVKTTESAPATPEEAFDTYLQVPFALRMLATGLTQQYECADGTVELEVLTPDGAIVWSWSVSDAATIALAASEVELVAEPWHTDFTWRTHPSPACGWCDVRRWCPDRDAWADAAAVSPLPDGSSVA